MYPRMFVKRLRTVPATVPFCQRPSGFTSRVATLLRRVGRKAKQHQRAEPISGAPPPLSVRSKPRSTESVITQAVSAMVEQDPAVLGGKRQHGRQRATDRSLRQIRVQDQGRPLPLDLVVEANAVTSRQEREPSSMPCWLGARVAGASVCLQGDDGGHPGAPGRAGGAEGSGGVDDLVGGVEVVAGDGERGQGTPAGGPGR